MDQNGSNRFEFTPIGYLKEKQNGGEIPTKRGNETINNGDGNDTLKKVRRTSMDNSLDSMRMFNDTSQFDDTLPQLNTQHMNRAVRNKRNLMDELKENAQTSNPLKEQQEKMHKLTTDNYNLRLKCNSLLKFLNNVTDEGELKKSLNLLDEVQDWKEKYNNLEDEFTELKKKYDELDIKTSEIAQNDSDINGSNKQSTLEQKVKLQKTEAELKQFQAQVKRLEKLHMDSNDTNLLESQKYKYQVDLLKSDLNKLNLKLHEKEKDFEEQEQRLYRLTNQLQEFDHKGGESLLRLESELEMKNTSIKNLEKELVSLTHGRQSLEAEVRALEKNYDELQEKYANYQKEYDSDVILAKNDKIRSLSQDKIELSNSIKKLNEDHELLKSKMQNVGNDKLTISNLEEELKQTKRKMDDAVILTKKLQNQIIDNTTKNTEKSSQRVREKDLEIETLKRKIEMHEEEYEKNIQVKIRKLEKENDLSKDQLNRQILLLQEEAGSIRESYERELMIWKDKCNSLSKENSKIQEQGQDSLKDLKRELNSKNSEMERLNNLIARSKEEQLEVNRTISRLQNSKDSYKEELKKIGTKFEYLSKEYVKLKEKESNMPYRDKGENQVLKEKYNTMKQRLLEELRSLQDENLSLERRLLDRSSRSQDNNIPLKTNTINQDQIDYYRLKYNTEVRQNNDLRIMNEYLNRVLRASSQHVRLDLLKIRNEVKAPIPSVFRSEFQNPLEPFHRRRHLRFDTVALFVLSCVRMKHAAIRRKWDEQRLKYLQRKITIDDGRISW